MEKIEHPPTPWSLAVMLMTRWLENHERVDALLDSLPRDVAGVDRARCQHLLFGAVRYLGRVEAHLTKLIERAPRPRLQAILFVAGFELIEGRAEGEGLVARVVHHAVEQTKTLASQPEARMVNAVVRKLAAALNAENAPPKFATSAQLAAWFSHPEWLVQRWLAQFGAQATRQFLEWNQMPAPVYARWRCQDRTPTETELTWLTASQWAGFYEVKSGHWPAVEAAIAAGDLYLQDPSTRLAVELLAPSRGERILDACAAPGGKSLAIADAGAPALLVALDLPSARIERLRQNVSRVKAGVEVTIVEGDLLRSGAALLSDNRLPSEYDGVLLDAPCSNTGVMRHRVDVKWRLELNDFTKHGRQQLALLDAAARRVANGGRLVYSTCSVDIEENANVVAAFLKRQGIGEKFVLEKLQISLPWESGHDGAAAFLLRRKT